MAYTHKCINDGFFFIIIINIICNWRLIVLYVLRWHTNYVQCIHKEVEKIFPGWSINNSLPLPIIYKYILSGEMLMVHRDVFIASSCSLFILLMLFPLKVLRFFIASFCAMSSNKRAGGNDCVQKHKWLLYDTKFKRCQDDCKATARIFFLIIYFIWYGKRFVQILPPTFFYEIFQFIIPISIITKYFRT